MCSLWSIRLVVFVNQDFKNMISHVQQSSVKTGIANALGKIFRNSVITFFRLNDSFAFVLSVTVLHNNFRGYSKFCF